MNFTKRFFLFSVILICALTLNSCRRSIGYSVLLWDIPEKNLRDGQIVKVYFKSNISHVYVINNPLTNENLEVPLWQLTAPASKRKAEAELKKYQDYQHRYARVKVDGLPVRAEAANTAKQVYRLHKNETIKILYRGEGEDVMVGKNEKLEGDWLCIMTNGGTQGWCFSHSLAVFATGSGGEVLGGNVEELEEDNGDILLSQVLQSKWYPESYRRLLQNGTIDLETMKIDAGFDTGAESGKVKINIQDRLRSANYAGVTKLRENVYEFKDTPFQMIINSADKIIVNYRGVDTKPEAYTFVTISDDYDIPKLINTEKARRAAEMQKLYNVDSFESQSYGVLVFTGLDSFTWRGFYALVPLIIPQDAREQGNVSIKYLISKNLEYRFDGILTFEFNGADDEVNFFYKNTSNGLSLEFISEHKIKNNIASSLDDKTVSIFFNRE